MFLRILKKDLTRKKTMNIILLIFVILSAMFASSSINNMISVYGGIDYFCDKAGMSDYVVISRNSEGMNPSDEIIRNAGSITEYRKEDTIYYASNNLLKNGETYCEFENAGVITCIDNVKLNYFNRDNEVITEVSEGHVYVGGLLADPDKTTIGDRITIKYDDVEVEVVIDGYIKDALFGSPFLQNARILMNAADYDKLAREDAIQYSNGGAIYYIFTDDLKALKGDMSSLPNALFAKEKSVLRMTYMLDMLTAGLLLVVSICLILIAFTMLSFTIKFTLNEDFREIGVMKAVGLKNRQIRGLYMVKYLFISLIGAVIGYFASIPFGKLLLASVSDTMVLGNDDQVFIGIISALVVVLIILAFCYSCTRSIRKLSPIDAVRNGETGERHHRRSSLRLSKSPLESNFFLALNDVVSKPRQYVSMVITFTVCILLIAMLANAANTLTSDNLIFLFGTTESDVYYNSTEKIMEIMGNSNENIVNEMIDEIEETLRENNMPGEAHIELMYLLPVEFGDTRMQVQMQQCKTTKTTDYVYNEGVAPLYENEIAFTPQIMEQLGASIGDKIIMEVNGERREFIITATFISFNQLGECGRVHQDLPLKSNELASAFGFQIDFDDHPDAAEIENRIERLKTIFDTTKIYNTAEFVDTSTSSSSTITMAKNMVIIIALIIAALITVLMERSFISNEVNEIALMKAIGFKNRSITAQHTLRFVVVVIISGILAGLLDLPFTKLVCDRIFGVMGAISGIVYDIHPLEIFVIYPVILMCGVIIAAYLTSLLTKTIHPDSMGNIE